MALNVGKYKHYLGDYAGNPAWDDVVAVIVKVLDALWGQGDAQAAWSDARNLRLDDSVPAPLLIKLLVTWGNLASMLGRYSDAESLLRRTKSLLSPDASPELRLEVMDMEGLNAANSGNLIRREKLFLQSRAITREVGPTARIGTFLNLAHFLALMGRESEVDADSEGVGPMKGRAKEHMLLVRFIQAVETGRFADAAAMAESVARLDWEISGHRAFFLQFMALAGRRWGLVAGGEGVGRETEPLPLWAEVMDHLLANRPTEALECARREAGADLFYCVTKTGLDSFNLVRAELANGNWQAAVRLIGLRRARGNVHYLDDYFLAAACLIADQKRDAAAHFAMVEKACRKHGASGRLKFELRMACGLRPADVYWLTRSADEPLEASVAAVVKAAPSRAEAKGLDHLIGRSSAMDAVREAVTRLAPMNVPVLITGEPGAGKELVARALHEAGPRAGEPFLAVNCGAISESLLESELFGHVKGASPGGAAAYRGLFEEAGRGTILLDEIGDAPPRLQAGLLRLLESGEFSPVGSSAARKVACRVIAATSADLAGKVEQGLFRKDLGSRIERQSIHIPALRERPEDIVPLALRFLAEGRPDGRQPELSVALQEALRQARLPGNVRELRNAMERARLLNSEKLAYDLPDVELSPVGPAVAVPPAPEKNRAAGGASYSYLLGEYAGVPAYAGVTKVIVALNDAGWGQGDAQLAWNEARSLRLDNDVPAPLLIKLLISWSSLASKLQRYAEAESLLRRAKSLLPRDASAEERFHVMGMEGAVAGNLGNMVRQEKIFRQIRESAGELSPASRATAHLNFAHFLARLGRESEVDAEGEKLGSLKKQAREWLALSRFIQAVETGRFADAAAMAETVGKFDWDFSARATYMGFMELARGRWGLVAGTEDVRPEPERLPLWAEVLDHLLAGRPGEALACARREAGDNLEGCVTTVGFNSFNLVRAELAIGNWQAAVRLIGLRRARGNVNYLDDYFLAAACLLAGQRGDAAAHFARVQKACDEHSASGRLEFELRMACGLRPANVYWLSRAAEESRKAPAASVVAAAPEAPARGTARLIGSSGAMAAVREAILRLAPLDVPVLITGETGVGKELVARALHEAGPRAEEPFLAVNCGAISESLLESELFGHEKGAFTGAAGAHRGLFEEAGRGTILLDEIGDTPERLQVSLLRVLETGEIRPVGSAAVRRVACRIVAATNAELARKAEQGQFRKDLFFRLKRMSIDIPPLRERSGDAVELALHFLAEGRTDGRRPEISEALREALCRSNWPGNVRELRNVMERARLLNSEKLSYDLPDVDLRAGGPAATEHPPPPPAAEAPGADASPSSDVAAFLRRRRSGFRRLDRLRELFREHGKFSRAEIVEVLKISPKTATADLRSLIREGVVEKVTPSASRRTHYFRSKAGRPPE